MVADAEDFRSRAARKTDRRDAADIAVALDDGGRAGRLDLELVERALDQIDDAAPGRLAPADRPAERYRLAGHDLGHGVADMHRIGVHEPSHDLLVGAHIGAPSRRYGGRRRGSSPCI